jgi:hypothetical protein
MNLDHDLIEVFSFQIIEFRLCLSGGGSGSQGAIGALAGLVGSSG